MRKIEGLGKVSCSRLSAVMGSPTAWISYREDLRREWVWLGDPAMLTGQTMLDELRITNAMRHGRDTEQRALSEFLLKHPDDFVEFTKESVLSVISGTSNVVIHPRHPWFCGTPDLRFPKSGVEVKCPVNEDRHVLDGQPLPNEYYPQIQGYLSLTDAIYWWFVSYFIMDGKRALYTERKIQRDDAYIERMLTRAERFWDYVVQNSEMAVYDYYPPEPGFESSALPVLF